MSNAELSPAAAPFLQRVWHQFRHECRRQRYGMIVVWLAALSAVVRQWAPPPLPHESYWPATAEMKSQLFDSLLLATTYYLPVWLAGRCVWTSRPGALELATHTRPIGRAALLLGQVAFLVAAVIMPRAMMTLAASHGFGFTPWMQLMAVMGNLIESMAIVGAAAVLASWATTPRQFAAMVTAAVVGVMVWSLCFSAADWLWEQFSKWQMACIRMVMHLLFAVGLCGACLWHLLAPRGRGGLAIFVITLIVAPLTPLWWRWDWMKSEQLRYIATALQTVSGDAGKTFSQGTQPLWAGLGVTGLPPGYSASVEMFAPKFFGRQDFRSKGYYSDLQQIAQNRDYYDSKVQGSRRLGMQTDLVRALIQRNPNWTWQDSVQTTRAPLTDVWQNALGNQSGGAVPESWRLLLAVHEPRLALEMTLRELLARHHVVTLEPGLRMEVARMEFMGDSLYYSVTVDSLWPNLLRRRPSAEMLPDTPQAPRVALCAIVMLDEAHHVAQAHVVIGRKESVQGIDTSGNRFVFGSGSSPPELRMKVTGMSADEWAEHVRVQIWWPQPRGTVELEVATKEMARLAQQK